MASLRPPAAGTALSSSLRRGAAPRIRLPRPVNRSPACSVRWKSGPYGYTQAKALVFSKFGDPSDVLHLHNHSISPSLPSHAVLLRTLAASINPADINTVQGTYGVLPSFSPLVGTAEPSAIPGNEGCFEVVAAGPGVTSVKKGDWVVPAQTGLGTWRTHAMVERADAALLKVGGEAGHEGLTPLQAATVSVNPSSAFRMLRDYVDLVDLSVQSFRSGGGARGGAWFIQNGANGGVGRAAIQLARLWGLRSINVVRERDTPEATEGLKQELRDLGATVVLTEAEFLDRSFKERLKEEITNGGREPVMLGLNSVGGKSATAVAKSLSTGGTLVTYGGMARQPVQLPTGLLIFKDITFKGFWLSRITDQNRELKHSTINEILGLIRDGKFKEPPVQELRWDWDTEEKTLVDAIQGTLQGFRTGKGVFVFGDT